MTKIQYLWFGGKDGWQVTSFDPREDAAIGYPRNGDVRLFVDKAACDKAVNLLKDFLEAFHAGGRGLTDIAEDARNLIKATAQQAGVQDEKEN